MLSKFGKVISPRCLFCKLHDETIMHLFCYCLIVKTIWNQLKSILSNNLNFTISTPQSAIFGFSGMETYEYLVLKNLLLIFKMCISNARTTGYLNIIHLLIYIKDIKDTKKVPKLGENDAKRRKNLTRNGKMFLINYPRLTNF